jgi:hypothetical protein
MGGLVVSKGNVYIIFKIVFSRNKEEEKTDDVEKTFEI